MGRLTGPGSCRCSRAKAPMTLSARARSRPRSSASGTPAGSASARRRSGRRCSRARGRRTAAGSARSSGTARASSPDSRSATHVATAAFNSVVIDSRLVARLEVVEDGKALHVLVALDQALGQDRHLARVAGIRVKRREQRGGPDRRDERVDRQHVGDRRREGAEASGRLEDRHVAEPLGIELPRRRSRRS